MKKLTFIVREACKYSCGDFCLAESLQQKVAELEAELAAANKRIEDSQKQEPVAKLNPYKDGWILIDHALTKCDYSKAIPLYAEPIIPPDVADIVG